MRKPNKEKIRNFCVVIRKRHRFMQAFECLVCEMRGRVCVSPFFFFFCVQFFSSYKYIFCTFSAESYGTRKKKVDTDQSVCYRVFLLLMTLDARLLLTSNSVWTTYISTCFFSATTKKNRNILKRTEKQPEKNGKCSY